MSGKRPALNFVGGKLRLGGACLPRSPVPRPAFHFQFYASEREYLIICSNMNSATTARPVSEHFRVTRQRDPPRCLLACQRK